MAFTAHHLQLLNKQRPCVHTNCSLCLRSEPVLSSKPEGFQVIFKPAAGTKPNQTLSIQILHSDFPYGTFPYFTTSLKEKIGGCGFALQNLSSF